MNVDWSPLRRAVSSQDNVQIWWRDDDAVARTEALDQLLSISDEVGLPVHLAVIPGRLETTLAPALESTTARVLIHGWRHDNHAAPEAKKAEFMRNDAAARDEAQLGFDTLTQAFGTRCDPIFVPPWNRIHPGLVAALPGMGYRGLSTFGPQQPSWPVAQYHTHVDPIFWRGHRSLVEPSDLISTAVAQLRTEPQIPLGLLTHHLVHDAAIWGFTRAILCELLDAGARPWSWKEEDEPT